MAGNWLCCFERTEWPTMSAEARRFTRYVVAGDLPHRRTYYYAIAHICQRSGTGDAPEGSGELRQIFFGHHGAALQNSPPTAHTAHMVIYRGHCDNAGYATAAAKISMMRSTGWKETS